jgi:hypothetical protein
VMMSVNDSDYKHFLNNCNQLPDGNEQTQQVVSNMSAPVHAKATDAASGHSLLSIRSISVLLLWYLFSFGAIFLNKYIIDTLQVEVIVFCKYNFQKYFFIKHWKFCLQSVNSLCC